MSSVEETHKLITIKQRRLQKLREQQALKGINTPPEVLLEIEDIEAELGQLKRQLETEQAQLEQTLHSMSGLEVPGTAEFKQQLEGRLQAIETQLAELRPGHTVFDQRGQRVEQQVNVAGDYIDQRREQTGSGPDPAALRRSYLHRLLQETRRLPLAGVDPKAAREEESQQLRLSAVYTALLTQRSEEAEKHERAGITWSWEESKRQLSALEVLNREPRLALLGDPGSGKSTFVNFVALCLAGELLGDLDANLETLTAPLPVEASERRDREEPPPRQPWDIGLLLPVRIVLRDLAARGLPEPGQTVDGDTLWAFIVAELGETLKEFAPHLKKSLQEEGGLILLDGLDEVPDAHQRRVQVKQAVQGFAADFPRCRFVVTSRTYAYQRQDWKLDGFAEAVLSPFRPAQINRFIESWYTHVGLVQLGINTSVV